MDAATIISGWPYESREAAQIVIDQYGEPHEATDSQLTWFDVGEFSRVVATREFWEHRFPAPHHDSVESVIDYRVPPGVISALAEFDGSVVARRTMGELSATCHDVEANRLALNLAHDIVVGERNAADARAYYAEEFLNARRGKPTPYMDRLHFAVTDEAADPDEQLIDDAELEAAENSSG